MTGNPPGLSLLLLLLFATAVSVPLLSVPRFGVFASSSDEKGGELNETTKIWKSLVGHVRVVTNKILQLDSAQVQIGAQVDVLLTEVELFN